MTLVDDDRTPLPLRPLRNKKGQTKSMSRKQLRARARRSKKGGRSEEYGLLYKPIEEWDSEELARGRPRDRNGHFSGPGPKWLTREMHEESMTRFRQVVKDSMNGTTIKAVDVIVSILENDELDDKGKLVVPPSTKLAAATFLLEHVVGKPTQRQETDISVKLQAVLASSIITPGVLPAFPNAKQLAPGAGVEDAELVDDEDD
jgi:hypothetical protein